MFPYGNLRARLGFCRQREGSDGLTKEKKEKKNQIEIVAEPRYMSLRTLTDQRYFYHFYLKNYCCGTCFRSRVNLLGLPKLALFIIVLENTILSSSATKRSRRFMSFR